GSNLKLLQRKMLCFSIPADERTARMLIGRTVTMAHAVEHDLFSVVQLQAEPIPALLIRRQLIGAELVVHPAFAAHAYSLAIDSKQAGGRHPCHRVVMRRPAIPVG